MNYHIMIRRHFKNEMYNVSYKIETTHTILGAYPLYLSTKSIDLDKQSL